MLVLKGRVIDGNGGEPIEKGAVVIEGKKILLVCPERECPEYPHAQVISIEDGTIMPGLIEQHVHMGWGSATAANWITSTPQLTMARTLKELEMLRNSGYTAIREMGGEAIFLKPAVAEGLLDCPRICGSGKFLTQIGGHGDVYQKITLEAITHTFIPGIIVTGADEVRRACRVNARNGADFIKIMTTGGVFSQGDKATPHSHFSQEEIRAAVEEAENMGSYVSTHAQANRGIKLALKNGVKSIEHGFYLDDECIEIMLKNECYLVPTLSIMHTSKMFFQRQDSSLDYLKEKTYAAYEAHYRSVERAHQAGVKIGMGCDFLGDENFGCTYDKATMEIERLEVAGLSPLEIITSATKIGAELILMADQLGTLEAGKLADIILVKGNPAVDIKLLTSAENIKVVVQDGKIKKDILAAG